MRQQELLAIKKLHKCDNNPAHYILKGRYCDESPLLFSYIAKKSNYELNNLKGPQHFKGPELEIQ